MHGPADGINGLPAATGRAKSPPRARPSRQPHVSVAAAVGTRDAPAGRVRAIRSGGETSEGGGGVFGDPKIGRDGLSASGKIEIGTARLGGFP